MPIPDSEQARKELVRKALEARAPAYYRKLKMAGQLDAVLAERADLMEQTYETIAEQAMSVDESLPYLERVGSLNNALSRAAEVAIAQATEFPSEEPTTE